MTFAMAYVIIFAVAKVRCYDVSPRMGRPPKSGQSKTVSLQLRITENTAEKLKYCAETLGVSRTVVIENGVDLMFERLKKK